MKLQQVALYASDLERAKAYWSRLLGAEPTGYFPRPGLLFFDLDGTRLLLDEKAPASLVYLRVDDVRAAVQGLEVTSEPHVIFTHTDDSLGPAGTVEWQAFVRDPDGNTVGFIGFEQE